MAKKGERGKEKKSKSRKMTIDVAFKLRQLIRGTAGKQDTGSKFQSKAVRGKKLDEYHRVFALGTDTV